MAEREDDQSVDNQPEDKKSSARNLLKVSRKTFINPTAWVDLDSIITQNKVILGICKNIMTPAASGTPETFEEVVKRQGLTEKDIKEGIVTYRTLAFVFLLFSLASLFYMVYQIVRYESVIGATLSLVVAALFFSQVFKYDFWAMQMRQRKLGLTIADWKRQYLGK